MKQSVFFTVDATVLCLILFIGCIVMVIAGKKARDKFLKTDEQESKGGVNSLLAALFSLWAFLLAFIFNSSYGRFENVRAMMVEESNMIRTAILRVDALPDSLQGGFRQDLKKYLQARIDYFEYAADVDRFNQSKQDAVAVGKALWKRANHVLVVPGYTFAANNLFAALTGMFDTAARRDALLMSGIPWPISLMLFFIALVISFVGGFTTPLLKMKEWVVITGFILLACLIILITLDLARPMRGLIRPDVGQEKLVQLMEML